MKDKVISVVCDNGIFFVKTSAIKFVAICETTDVKDTYDLRLYIENYGWLISGEHLSIQLAKEMARKVLEEGELQYY